MRKIDKDQMEEECYYKAVEKINKDRTGLENIIEPMFDDLRKSFPKLQPYDILYCIGTAVTAMMACSFDVEVVDDLEDKPGEYIN